MGITESNKPKLLITEDDIENRKFLELFLKKYFLVDVCDSSDSFYFHIGHTNYDIILMDISIKGSKNGLDLTREMKSNPAYRNIPILCYTAHAFSKDRNNALEAGCDGYISKPSDIRTLLDAISDLLKQSGNNYIKENSSQEYTIN